MHIEQEAERKNSQHLCREKGIGKRHSELAALHPVVVVRSVGAYLVDKARIGLFALIIRFDDLDIVYVFDYSAAHLACRLDSALIILGIAAHDHHHKNKGDWKHGKRRKRKPKIQYKQINDR